MSTRTSVFSPVGKQIFPLGKVLFCFCLQIFKGHESSVRSLAYSPSGKHLASASLAGEFMLWSANGSIVSQFIVRRSLCSEIVISVAAFHFNSFILYLVSEPISGQYPLSIPPGNIRKPENELIHFFIFIPPENARKPLVFGCFQRVQKGNIGLKQMNPLSGFLIFSEGIEREHWFEID